MLSVSCCPLAIDGTKTGSYARSSESRAPLGNSCVQDKKLETEEKPGFFPSRPVFQSPKKPGFLAQSFFCPVHSGNSMSSTHLKVFAVEPSEIPEAKYAETYGWVLKFCEQMKHAIKILLVMLTGVVLLPAHAGNEGDIFEMSEEDMSEFAEDLSVPPYIIGPGDVLDISVWKNKEMSRLVTVLPDGKIAFPLIGEIVAAGKTVAQLKMELEQNISPRFILNPVLTLEVRQINSMLIYVIGRVNHPGRFSLNTTINVLQALSMARGLTPFAKRNDIRIFREERSETRMFLFRYDDVTQGIALDQNIRLKRGDVIVVP